MARDGVSSGKVATKVKAEKPKPKSTKPRGKVSAVDEAAMVASKAIHSPGASSRRSRSPDVPPDNLPTPRFVRRSRSPDPLGPKDPANQLALDYEEDSSHFESEAPHTSPHSERGTEDDKSKGAGSPGDEPMDSPASSSGAKKPKTLERPLSPADGAMYSPSTAGDAAKKPKAPLRNLMLAEGRQRAKAAKQAAAEAKHDKKRSASSSPREEVIRTNDKNFFESPGEEGEEKEDRLITNDLDNQQAVYAAQGVARTHAVVPPRSNTFSSPRSGGPSYPRGVLPTEPRSWS
ncbi:hypothetical protein PI124_g21730 [Phytophthora idaei]|nr:hypothetical protein PI125_g23635 [Phytophthora idaei]KAG3127932.1 hypothetical protein PI126_g21629 [Phytophthora idaei]KAG3233193.1 hypothetical protein PI124_g21730 [Phytophthora idaei]